MTFSPPVTADTVADIFDLAMERDDAGVGVHSTEAIAAKLDVSGTTVRRVLREHERRSELPSRRWRTDGRAAPRSSGDAPTTYRPQPRRVGGRSSWHAGTPRIQTTRVIETTVAELVGCAHVLALLDDAAIAEIDADRRLEWVERIAEPLRAIHHLRDVLR